MKFDLILITAVVSALLVIVIMCLLYCLRCRRRDRNALAQRNVPTASSNIYTVPANYCTVSPSCSTAPVHGAPPVNTIKHLNKRISSQGDRFAVPLDLLPPTFNFNDPDVIHKGDYVLIKDLNLIEFANRDEYQKQSPYNPNFA